MNHHKNARLTFSRRLEMVRLITDDALTTAQAAAAAGMSEPTARKWLGRYLAAGKPALADASSRPAVSRASSTSCCRRMTSTG
jgi:transposase-like protein